MALELIKTLPLATYIIADKGYDSEEIREQIKQKKSTPVIPKKKNSKSGNYDLDLGLYKCRHLVENLFARLKHFRAIATRYDKLKRNGTLYTGSTSNLVQRVWVHKNNLVPAVEQGKITNDFKLI